MLEAKYAHFLLSFASAIKLRSRGLYRVPEVRDEKIKRWKCSSKEEGDPEEESPSPSNCVTPFACKLLSEQGFGFRKADVVECRVFASHFPSDEVQNETGVRGSTPVSANDWGKNMAAWPYSLSISILCKKWSWEYSSSRISRKRCQWPNVSKYCFPALWL